MTYLTAAQVRERYQISPTSLWRWQQDESLKFPQPFVVKRKKLFRADDLARWERERAKVPGQNEKRQG
ncbi:helix-turn-helix domain-containing protein [Sinorhizobium fredii]|uniref:Helix-turn-helix domain-containing protein n=1 Tax=Rhizobium fredii TaxID=380 RepID=A0A2A6LYP9_RHIFR|nr:helix-turn-helix domain-containing protein [Sinorhizobium fredii]PDT47467.1 helix-turn-helix domain-containing protein [Sinorhizobium fredii]